MSKANESDGGGGVPKNEADAQPVEISAFQLDDEDEDEPLKQQPAAKSDASADQVSRQLFGDNEGNNSKGDQEVSNR